MKIELTTVLLILMLTSCLILIVCICLNLKRDLASIAIAVLIIGFISGVVVPVLSLRIGNRVLDNDSNNKFTTRYEIEKLDINIEGIHLKLSDGSTKSIKNSKIISKTSEEKPYLTVSEPVIGPIKLGASTRYKLYIPEEIYERDIEYKVYEFN